MQQCMKHVVHVLTNRIKLFRWQNFFQPRENFFQPREKFALSECCPVCYSHRHNQLYLGIRVHRCVWFYLFVCCITQKWMIPKSSNLVQRMTLRISYKWCGLGLKGLGLQQYGVRLHSLDCSPSSLMCVLFPVSFLLVNAVYHWLILLYL